MPDINNVNTSSQDDSQNIVSSDVSTNSTNSTVLGDLNKPVVELKRDTVSAWPVSPSAQPKLVNDNDSGSGLPQSAPNSSSSLVTSSVTPEVGEASVATSQDSRNFMPNALAGTDSMPNGKPAVASEEIAKATPIDPVDLTVATGSNTDSLVVAEEVDKKPTTVSMDNLIATHSDPADSKPSDPIVTTNYSMKKPSNTEGVASDTPSNGTSELNPSMGSDASLATELSESAATSGVGIANDSKTSSLDMGDLVKNEPDPKSIVDPVDVSAEDINPVSEDIKTDTFTKTPENVAVPVAVNSQSIKSIESESVETSNSAPELTISDGAPKDKTSGQMVSDIRSEHNTPIASVVSKEVVSNEPDHSHLVLIGQAFGAIGIVLFLILISSPLYADSLGSSWDIIRSFGWSITSLLLLIGFIFVLFKKGEQLFKSLLMLLFLISVGIFITANTTGALSDALAIVFSVYR